MSAPYKTILCIDAETRWDRAEYTLSKMTTEAYIRDPRFKAFGFCIHEYGSPTPIQWYSHKELPHIFSMYDWSKTAVLAQNSMFDAGILSFIYGVHPCFIFDTLSMARALRGAEGGNSLAKLAAHYGLPPKGNAVHSTDGLIELPREVEKELAEYCVHDVFLCERIFSKLVTRDDTPYAPGQYDVAPNGEDWMYPKKELRLIDMTLKMFTEPQLVLNAPLLVKALEEDNAKLASALARVGVEPSELASNDKFAEVLRMEGIEPPTKPSPANKDKQIYAFAKSDAMFQSMLNGDNEDVALLCEARLRVKSTQARTRAQRFIDIAGRGEMPVPLNYAAANTFRWGGTQQINLQNLKRGSALRLAIEAPDGYEVVVGDLSQIEPRVLAWLSDYDWLLDVFRAGGDPYATFGGTMFSIPGMTKEEYPLLRQSAKSAMLGCFGADTKVLTQRGWVPIVRVQATDTTWDGKEWTTHKGLLSQGEKSVLTMHGVSATWDHEILTERGWQEWSEVATSPSLFRSALSLANLPAFLGTKHSDSPNNTVSTPFSQECGVLADGRGTSIGQAYGTDAQQDAIAAPKRNRWPRWNIAGGLWPSAQTVRTAIGSLTASARSLFGVRTPKAKPTPTTAGVASTFTRLGSRIASPFSRILSLLLDGILPRYSLIGSTTTRDTSPGTCASSHAASTWPTSERSLPERSSPCSSASPPLSQRMQTYDIAMAGPRNRYTILTDEGPILVHNCGFQLGWASFAAQLLVGFLGAPPVRYNKAQARQLGVDGAMVKKFLSWNDNLVKMSEIAHVCTDEELLIHCLASKAIIDKYRAAAEPVVAFWELLGNLIEHSLVGGQVYDHKGVLQFRKGEIELVSGMCIRYTDIKAEKDKKGRLQYSYQDGRKRVKLYAGKICNNCIAEGTEVLTDCGWVPIEHIDAGMRVHDGIEFVRHAGLVCNGVQGCVTVDGIYMTPDHPVLTNKGWEDASQVQEPYRPDIRNADGNASRNQCSRRMGVAVSVPVRPSVCEGWGGDNQTGQARENTELRMRNKAAYVERNSATRDGKTPGLYLLEKYAQPLLQGVGSRIQKLRSAGDNCLCALERVFRELLGRYGASLCTRAYTGTKGQPQGVFPRELLLGHAFAAGTEHPQNHTRSERAGVLCTHGAEPHNHILPTKTRMATRVAGASTRVQQQKQVYDIVNCGPRHRFVVRGVNGPFIVHNCVQATARVVMTDGMLRVQSRFAPKFTVHDEFGILVPTEDVPVVKPWFKAQMTQVPKWMPGIPLDADVGSNKSYGLAK